MITIDTLKEYGANVEEGLERCMKNEALYLRLVNTILNEEKFDTLKESLETGNIETAFESAHALKGVSGNLSLTPLYEPLVEITELLRHGETEGCPELLAEIIRQKEILERINSTPE